MIPGLSEANKPTQHSSPRHHPPLIRPEMPPPPQAPRAHRRQEGCDTPGIHPCHIPKLMYRLVAPLALVARAPTLGAAPRRAVASMNFEGSPCPLLPPPVYSSERDTVTLGMG